ncbi:NADH-dependent oxidoreductase [Lacticaseibacillus baoqingensis]|uniref:NADH-dependent oxidoreductase n=1 Tax=Lacticaseibacillus baoqingensis TaxID=2486013 RepID=A0ABW4EA71_9LACO|nr:hypothetical protein [Lacticaseibacillus baoqingensis]
MTESKALSALTLGNGVQVANRLMMSAMCDLGGTPDGQVTQEQIDFMQARAGFGALLVTAAAYPQPNAKGLPGQYSVANDADVAGLSRLAAAMKSRGAKAILQIAHSGREAAIPAQQGLRVVAPSKMTFPWIKYPIAEMTAADVDELIADYGKATQRAIDAGFDGVEIHNCNHDLLQQFFSAYSNHRSDQWGGSFEKRAALPLAVLKELHRVITAANKPEFIVGWRISPEEVHGETVGYTVDDMLKQTKLVLAAGIDYLNLSLTGLEYRYDSKPAGHAHTFAQLFHAIMPANVPLYIGSQVHTPADVDAALADADGVYMAREALVDPEFTDKLKAGRTADIITTMSEARLKQVHLPKALAEEYATPGGFREQIPLVGLPN